MNVYVLLFALVVHQVYAPGYAQQSATAIKINIRGFIALHFCRRCHCCFSFCFTLVIVANVCCFIIVVVLSVVVFCLYLNAALCAATLPPESLT